MLPTDPAVVDAYLQQATPAERDELMRLLDADLQAKQWRAQVGRQSEAADSKADVVGYGGAAGGGKTDLVAGLALTEHQRSAIFRREKTQTEGVIQRITEILGSTDGFNSQKSIWRTSVAGVPRLIEFGGLDNSDDHQKWQGRPHDLKAVDEATECREHQVRFVLGWNRTADAKQRTRALLTFNPPTTTEGRWVIAYFAPWLDNKFHDPAKPGELRWVTTINGKDVWMDGPEPFVIFKGEPLYEFDPADFGPEKIIRPKSRTFIPSRVTDNYFYVRSGYISTLQSLPEPLRSQMLSGDFKAGMEDDPWQVIPTAWIEAAMARWKEPGVKAEMDSMGVDVARGGKDQTTIARRHGNWFDRTLVYPGLETPDGPSVRGLVITAMRDMCPIHIDVIGVGASPYDLLREARQQVIGVNVAEKSLLRDRSGRLSFANQRSELWWKFREWLDPTSNTGAMIPDEPELLAELAAPKWSLRGPIIQVESRDEIVKRVGRSPDRASAYILGLLDTPKLATLSTVYGFKDNERDYDPYNGLMRD